MKSLLLVCLLSLSFVSCASKQADRYNSRKGGFFNLLLGRTTYQEAYDDRTVEERVHSEFEPVMTAYITLWDTTLRQFYIEEMRNQFRLPEDQEKNLAKEQLAEDEAFIVFILSTAVREPGWADFNKKNSMWRITLENADSSIQVDAERVEPIAAKDETAKYFYPRMGTFTPTFKVRFPRKPFRSSEKIYFHITGTRGAVVGEFELPPAKSAIDVPAKDR